MGWPLRVVLSRVTYHVYSRCINAKPYMKENLLKDMMMKVIKETQDKFDFEFIAFEVLDNHFHFVIKTTRNGESISKIMQRIKSVFAKRYNKKNNRSGPVWNERYGSKIIEHQENPVLYFFNLLRYLAYNSVRKKISIDPREYEYSSINHYLVKNYQNKYRIKITLHEFFIRLGATFEDRVKIFLEFEKFQCQR